MDVENLIVRLTADASQYTGVLNTAEARLATFAAMVSDVFVRQSVVMAAAYEKSAIAFETMSRSAEEGRKILADINNLAVESPFHSAELVDYAKQLQSFGFAGDQIVPILQTLGDVASGTGGRLDRIVLAFGQVRTAGRLMGQELRQFTNAGIPLMENLAAVLNKPVDQITHMVHTGQVGFNDVVRAFNRMTQEGGKFAGLMDRINKETVAGRWENMTERIQLSMRKVGQAFFEGFDVKSALDRFGNILDNIDTSTAVQAFRAVRQSLEAIFIIGDKGVSWLNAEFVDLYHKVVEAYDSGMVTAFVRENEAVLKTVAIIAGMLVGWSVSLRVIVYLTVQLTAAVRTLQAVIIAVRSALALTSVIASVSTLAGTIVSVLGSALSFILSPMAAIIASIALIVYGMNEIGSFQNFGDELVKGFNNFKTTALDTWNGIVAAVKSNDLETAVDIAFKGIQFAWRSALYAMHAEWKRFSFGLGSEILAGLGSGVVDVMSWFSRQMIEAAAKLKSVWASEQEVNNFRQSALGKLAKDQEGAQKEIQQMMENRRTELAPALDADIAALMKRRDAELAPLAKEIRNMSAQAQVSGSLGVDRSVVDVAKLTKGFATGEGGTLVVPNSLPLPDKLGNEVGSLMRPAYQKMYSTLVREAVYSFTAATESLAYKDPEHITSSRKNWVVQSAKNLSDFMQSVEKLNDIHKPVGGMLQVSARAQDAVAHLTKSLQDGLDPMDKFEMKVADLTEAFRGPLPALEALGGIPAAMAAGQKGIIDEDQYRKGLYLQYAELKKSLGDRTAPNLPPAMMYGTREAQDTISRTMQMDTDVQQEVLRNIIMGNVIREQARDYQRKVAETLERMEKSGPKIIGKGP